MHELAELNRELTNTTFQKKSGTQVTEQGLKKKKKKKVLELDVKKKVYHFSKKCITGHLVHIFVAHWVVQVYCYEAGVDGGGWSR